MTVVPQLTIAGNNDLASEVARYALASGVANPVYLWRDIRDPLPARTPMIVLAEPDERAGFARAAVESGVIAVSLPLPDPDAELTRAIEAGTLRQLSPLHGLPALDRLHRDARERREGRRYGIYAAHRLPRNHAGRADAALNDLVSFVAALGDGRVEHVRATSADLGESTTGWFVLARFVSGTIATIEVSPVLPDADEPHGEVLIEVTGSEVVLRAEPERQSVEVRASTGVRSYPWYAGPEPSLTGAAMDLLEHGSLDDQMAILDLTRSIEPAAQSDGIVTPPGRTQP